MNAWGCQEKDTAIFQTWANNTGSREHLTQNTHVPPLPEKSWDSKSCSLRKSAGDISLTSARHLKPSRDASSSAPCSSPGSAVPRRLASATSCSHKAVLEPWMRPLERQFITRDGDGLPDEGAHSAPSVPGAAPGTRPYQTHLSKGRRGRVFGWSFTIHQHLTYHLWFSAASSEPGAETTWKKSLKKLLT